MVEVTQGQGVGWTGQAGAKKVKPALHVAPGQHVQCVRAAACWLTCLSNNSTTATHQPDANLRLNQLCTIWWNACRCIVCVCWGGGGEGGGKGGTVTQRELGKQAAHRATACDSPCADMQARLSCNLINLLPSVHDTMIPLLAPARPLLVGFCCQCARGVLPFHCPAAGLCCRCQRCCLVVLGPLDQWLCCC